MNEIIKINNKTMAYFESGLFGSILYCFCIFFISYLIYKIIKRLIHKKDIDNGNGIINIIRGFFVIVVMMSCLLQIRTLQTFSKTILASSSILAVIIGIAAQDTLGNLFSGLMIITCKQFVIGDLIKINGEQLIGFVEEITLRHTVIRTYENNRIIIPNSEINKATIENANYTENTKGNYLYITISYESNIEKAIEIIQNEIEGHKYYLDERTELEIEKNINRIPVRLVEFCDSGIKLRAIVKSNDSLEGFEMLCDLRYRILIKFKENNIEIPYPHVTLTKKEPE